MRLDQNDSQAEKSGISKRALIDPRMFGLNMTRFMLHHWSGTRILGIPSSDSNIPTGSLYHRFHGDSGDQKVAITGMIGCTALMVVSRAGLYVVRFYEYPSFNAGFSNSILGRVRQDVLFWKHVSRVLWKGTVDNEGRRIWALLPFVEGVGQADQGKPEFKGPGDIVKVLIVTPR